jgi:hypothetical protein
MLGELSSNRRTPKPLERSRIRPALPGAIVTLRME